jgi:prevent-host-death family protein
MTLKKGPQVVARRGVETAVLVPIAEWASSLLHAGVRS